MHPPDSTRGIVRRTLQEPHRMDRRIPRFRFTRRLARIIAGIVGTIAILCALSTWLVPHLLRNVLTGNVASMLGREVTAGKISFNPFTLTVRMHDLAIAQPQGAAPLLAIDTLQASAAWSSVYRLAPVIDSILVSKPRVALVRTGATQFNFSDIVQKVNAQLGTAKPQKADESPQRFSLNNMVIEDGSVTMDDKVTGRKQVVDEIGLGVPFISNFGYATKINVLPRFHARINGSSFDLTGTARPFDTVPISTLNVNLKGLNLEPLADAWPAKYPFVLKSGRLDSDLQISFEQPKNAEARLRVTGDTQVSAFDLQEVNAGNLLKWDSLSLKGVDSLPLDHSLQIKQITLLKPEVQTRRDAQGHVNWLDIAAKLQQVENTTPAATTKPAIDTAATAAGNPAAQSPAAVWRIGLGSVNVQQGMAHTRDAGTQLDYALQNISFTTGPIALPQQAGHPIAFTFKTDNQADGQIDTSGNLMIAPLKLDLDAHIAHQALMPFAAAIHGVAPVRLKQGHIDLAAKLSLAAQAGGMAVSAKDVRVGLNDLSATYEAIKPAVDVSVHQLALAADHVAPGSQPIPFTLSARGLQEKGSLDFKGAVTLQPIALEGHIDLERLNVATLAPFFQSSLNAKVKAVALNARGDLKFAMAHSAAPMRVNWKGAVETDNLDLADRVTGGDFMKWKRLGLDAMTVSLAGTKFSADLGNVVLNDFYGRVILNQQGRLNVMDLVAGPGGAGGSITQDTQTRGRAAPANSKPGAMPDIAVRSVKVKNGSMTYSDNFVRPNYTAELSSITGSVSAVSSTKPSPAQVKIAGKVYRTAPFSLEGTVQPFAKYLALDLKASAKGVDLPRFNTYAAKYVGYTVERGKLSLDLQYKIKDKALQASNRVLLTQLTFGKKTNSPDATHLPVMLAVSLLRDRHGNIDLNLPVSGSLDDPSFSIGGVIVQVVVNLFSKAITSPFTLLSSAFGGGEELSYIDFPSGSAQLDDKGLARIDTLSKALNDRPSMKLDITGRADPKTDAEGLREQWLQSKIRAAKAEDQSTRKKEVDPASVTVSQAEQNKYLEKAYSDSDIKSKPHNFIGLSKSLPPDQMRSLMLAAAPAGAGALRALADARAQAVFEQLQKTVPADRMFIVASTADGKASDSGGEPSRVDFSLK